MFITIWARSCQMSLFRHAMRRHVHVFLFGWTAIVLIGHDRANSDRTQIKRSLIQTFKSAKKNHRYNDPSCLLYMYKVSPSWQFCIVLRRHKGDHKWSLALLSGATRKALHVYLYPDFSSLSPASFGFWYPKIWYHGIFYHVHLFNF